MQTSKINTTRTVSKIIEQVLQQFTNSTTQLSVTYNDKCKAHRRLAYFLGNYTITSAQQTAFTQAVHTALTKNNIAYNNAQFIQKANYAGQYETGTWFAVYLTV